jgi:hypothetical protein
MANKDLFKQAIAEAKSVREAAIANAKEALEETLTPHLKDMLAAKLQEMEDSQNEEETVNEMEEEEVEEMKHSKDKKDKVVEEDLTEVPEVAEAEEDEESEEAEEELPAEVEPEQSDDEAGYAEGDEELGNLTVDQFKDLIRDIIAQEMGAGEEMPADDMDAGDMEEPAADMGMGDDMPGEDEEEIDLDELLRELELASGEEETMEEDVTAKSTANQESAEPEAEGTNINRTVKEDARKELKEALATIESLKKDLQEVNLLNSKLLYVNKIFKANDLNESQKVNVIAAFDKAESVKEVKLVFETVSETFVTKKEATIKEQKLGMASKATGTTARKPEVITEVSDAVRRMQKLAGII